jgi:hypothetical protein
MVEEMARLLVLEIIGEKLPAVIKSPHEYGLPGLKISRLAGLSH